MIDFQHVWLPQLISYARLIDTGQIEQEWLGCATRTTSITGPDELHEQVFDDLDADAVWAGHRSVSHMPAASCYAIDAFLAALRAIEASEAAVVVASPAWVEVKRAANLVVGN